ncbi:Hypothetical protein A7982_10114 [Minicystis rosea]|nr:Hypothetical protein A7982_10114 [Minicystis rosea]
MAWHDPKLTRPRPAERSTNPNDFLAAHGYRWRPPTGSTRDPRGDLR